MPWNPQDTWDSGNFYPENGFAVEALKVAAAVPMADTGTVRDIDGSHPGLWEGANVGRDNMVTVGFNTVPIPSGGTYWDDDSTWHLEVHFTTAAARDAYATELAAAATSNDAAAIVANYKNHATGGYWGTMGDAL